MKILPAVIFVVSASFLGSTPSYGQSYSTVAWGSVQAGQDEAIAVNKKVSGQIYQKRAPVNAQQNVSTKFVANKSRTKQNLTAVVNHMRKTDSVNAAQMEQLFASNDIIGAVGSVMDRYGLERNNVAHAYALYWVVYWGLANKVYEAPSSKAMKAVAAQAEIGFSGSANFASMNDAQKQATAEELMALVAILDGTSEQAKLDPALAEKAAKASLEGSRKSGLDLDAMTLTEDGFVPAKGRKRSDASDVVGEGEEKALAANDVGDDKGTDLSATQLALIAAAGGAGLAGVFLFGKAMGKKG
jgi:hypothetical protein